MLPFSLFSLGQELHRQHHPHRKRILRVTVHPHPEGELDGVALALQNVRPYVAPFDARHDLPRVQVREAEGQALEAVPFGDGVLDGVLEVVASEAVAGEALVLVGGYGGLEEVREFGVPLAGQAVGGLPLGLDELLELLLQTLRDLGRGAARNQRRRIADGLRRDPDGLPVHGLPVLDVVEVPVHLRDAVVDVLVRPEAGVVEDARNRGVGEVGGVLRAGLASGDLVALPREALNHSDISALRDGADPGVLPLLIPAVGAVVGLADYHVRAQAEAEEQTA
mmetsp:Transcript_19091/g.35444  ORF Transcript_19091/g.35444 Transcript_19091/m.35444 type:complete len:280 (+) Transcript_19091:16-855(+)